MLEFENTAEFEVYFATYGPPAHAFGRNILFAFENAWEKDCENIEFREGIKSGGTGGGGGDPHIKRSVSLQMLLLPAAYTTDSQCFLGIICRWNRERFSFHGECDLVMIHSDNFHEKAGLDLHVRATHDETMAFSYFESAALRFGEHLMEIHRREIILDGQTYKTSDMPMTFGEEWSYTIREVPIPAHKNPNFHTYYELDLHHDSRILFKYYKNMLTVEVTGHQKDFSDSVGLMGEFSTGNMKGRNGYEISDCVNFGMEWQVNPAVDSILFQKNREPQLPFETCRMNSEQIVPNRRNLRQNTRLLKEAEQACASHDGGDFQLCIDDVMVMGDIEAAW